MYLLEARLNGIVLSATAKKDFANTLGNLVEAKGRFRYCISNLNKDCSRKKCKGYSIFKTTPGGGGHEIF